MKERCVIDFTQGIVRYQDENGSPVTEQMTRLMEALLDYLDLNRGYALSVEQIISNIWPDHDADANRDVHYANRLRDLIYLTKKRCPPLNECLPAGVNGRYTFKLPEGFRVIRKIEDRIEADRLSAEPPAPAAEVEDPVRVFHGLWDRARQSGPHEPPAAGKALLDYALKQLEVLKYALPVAEDPALRVPASRCAAKAGQEPLLLAELRLEQARRLAEQPLPKKDPLLRGERTLYAAIGQAERAAVIAREREDTERVWLRSQGTDAPPVAALLCAEAQTLLVRCYLELDRLNSTAAPEDRALCYLGPARTMWTGAQASLAEARRQGADPDALAVLEKTLLSLRGDVGALEGAPAVRVAKYRSRETRLVFNTVYDSVLAKTAAQRDLIRTQTLQMAATPGMRILLQLPQLLDNAYVTGVLLHEPGFQALCQKEIIVLSSYGSITDPKDYLLLNLEQADFRFSASPLLSEPSVRRGLARGLREDLPFYALGLPEQLEPLYEGYRLASRVFRPSSIRRYHQQLAPLYGGALAPGPQLELPEMAALRLRQLAADDALCPIAGRRARLLELEHVLAKAAGAGARTRSDYKALFQRWAGDMDGELLRLADRLVDLCYGYSSGYRSTRHILSAAPDAEDLLCIHASAEQPTVDPTGAVSYAMRFAAHQAEADCRSQRLELDSILELALIARRVYEEETDLDALPDRLRQETGVGYIADNGGGPVAGDFCVKNTEGAQPTLQHITPGPGAGFRVEFDEGGQHHET